MLYDPTGVLIRDFPDMAVSAASNTGWFAVGLLLCVAGLALLILSV